MKLIQNIEGSRILDLGCGTGRHVVYLSRQGFEVYGFDVSQKALSMTNEWLNEENLKANICEHRMEHPFPYEDNFFDAVISTQVIHHNMMKDIRKTIKEIERVLRLGGILFVTFPVFHPEPDNEENDWELVEVEDGTYIPNKGWESGIPHHYFTMNEIPVEFEAFDINEIFLDETGHRCVLAELRPP